MIKNKNRILSSEKKKPILYDVYYNETEKPLPMVIFCHGYKGFKDWGAWHLVAEAFAEAGFCFVKQITSFLNHLERFQTKLVFIVAIKALLRYLFLASFGAGMKTGKEQRSNLFRLT